MINDSISQLPFHETLIEIYAKLQFNKLTSPFTASIKTEKRKIFNKLSTKLLSLISYRKIVRRRESRHKSSYCYVTLTLLAQLCPESSTTIKLSRENLHFRVESKIIPTSKPKTFRTKLRASSL